MLSRMRRVCTVHVANRCVVVAAGTVHALGGTMEASIPTAGAQRVRAIWKSSVRSTRTSPLHSAPRNQRSRSACAKPARTCGVAHACSHLRRCDARDRAALLEIYESAEGESWPRTAQVGWKEAAGGKVSTKGAGAGPTLRTVWLTFDGRCRGLMKQIHASTSGKEWYGSVANARVSVLMC